MKTSQIKKFMPQPPHSIKLKFQNIRTQQNNNKFTKKDAANLNHVCNSIDNAIKKGQKLSQEVLAMNFNLLRKLRRTTDYQEESLANSNKIKFRVVKSAKKNQIQPPVSKTTEAYLLQQNKSTIVFPPVQFCENKSQLAQNKQNIMINFSKTEPKSSTVTSSSFTYKKPIKRKATQSKSGDGYEHGEIRMVPDEQLVKKLKGQAKMLLTQIQNKNKQNQQLSQRLKLLERQKEDLSKKIKQKQQKNNQQLKIDLKFSLKCIQTNQKESTQEQKPKQDRIGVKAQQKQIINKEDANRQEQSGYKLKMGHLQQLICQLQNMIVYQNKQIQNYRSILVKKQIINNYNANKQRKNEKWKNYY